MPEEIDLIELPRAGNAQAVLFEPHKNVVPDVLPHFVSTIIRTRFTPRGLTTAVIIEVGGQYQVCGAEYSHQAILFSSAKHAHVYRPSQRRRGNSWSKPFRLARMVFVAECLPLETAVTEPYSRFVYHILRKLPIE
jgi:hypothetical protein